MNNGKKSVYFNYFMAGIILLSVNTTGLAWQAIGWHWYNETNEIKPINTISEKNGKRKTATEQMQRLQKMIKDAKNQAILYPSEDNIRWYLLLQNYVMNKARVFTGVWEKTLLDYPSLDYSIEHPTENNAQSIVALEESNQETEAIHELSKSYGLLFFYRGQNLLDQSLASSISAFSKTYHIALIPISVDGKALIKLPETRINHGQAQALGVHYFPALVLVDPQTNHVRPVSYGFIAEDELKRRFLDVATNFNRDASNAEN